jgi:hypothetical protein
MWTSANIHCILKVDFTGWDYLVATFESLTLIPNELQSTSRRSHVGMTGQAWRAIMKYSQISEIADYLPELTTRINDDLMSLYGYGTDTKRPPIKERW